MCRRLILCLSLIATLVACGPPVGETPAGQGPGTIDAAPGALPDQQRGVRQAIGNPEVGVSNDGSNVTVMFPAAVLFAASSAVLSPAGNADVTRLAEHLRARMPGSTVIVVGHTDDGGTASASQAMSERRAQAVARALVAGGVPHLRIKALGQGAARPVASNSMPEGRALNQRVEIIIRPGA